MQNPCRTPFPTLARRLAGGFAAVALTIALPCQATKSPEPGGSSKPAASPAASPATSPAASPAAEAAAPLTDQARVWVARQLSMPVARVQVQNPDPRLRTPRCVGGLQFDAPFSNLNTVRVRCAEPAWQLYLRAQWDEPDAALAQTGAPAGAASPVFAGGTAGGPSTVAPGAAAGMATGTSPAPAQTTTAAAREPRRALAPSQTISRGALLSPASVDWVMVPARDADSTLVTDPAALLQVEAVRDLPAGQPLRHTDIRAAVLVRQGQLVTLTVGQGGFTITVRLEAMQDGRMGDRVMLRNAESGRTVSGVVTGLNSARGA